MPIKTVAEFYCPRCDYITRDSHQIESIRKTGICPACQNGSGKGWHDMSKRTEWEGK